MVPHARRVMDRVELETIQKLHDEFREAIDGTAGKTLPEDLEQANNMPVSPSTKKKGFGANLSLSKLRSTLNAKLGGVGSSKPT